MKPTIKQHSRRSVLKKGLLGGALLAAGGASFLVLRPSKLLPPPPEGLWVFNLREYSLVQAIAARMISDTPNAPTVEDVRLAFVADRTLAQSKVDAQKDVKKLLGLFENSLTQFLFGGRVQPFTHLTPLEQDEVLKEWQTSRISIRRTGFTALRTLVMACYYGNPAVWPSVGYPGPPRGIHDPNAPVWKGEGPRPLSYGLSPLEEP